MTDGSLRTRQAHAHSPGNHTGLAFARTHWDGEAKEDWPRVTGLGQSPPYFCLFLLTPFNEVEQKLMSSKNHWLAVTLTDLGPAHCPPPCPGPHPQPARTIAPTTDFSPEKTTRVSLLQDRVT